MNDPISYSDENIAYLDERIEVLTSNCINELQNEGFQL